jgi:hypothetical protein
MMGRPSCWRSRRMIRDRDHDAPLAGATMANWRRHTNAGTHTFFLFACRGRQGAMGAKHLSRIVGLRRAPVVRSEIVGEAGRGGMTCRLGRVGSSSHYARPEQTNPLLSLRGAIATLGSTLARVLARPGACAAILFIPRQGVASSLSLLAMTMGAMTTGVMLACHRCSENCWHVGSWLLGCVGPRYGGTGWRRRAVLR